MLGKTDQNATDAITRIAAVQRMTSLAEQAKDRNFCKPGKFCKAPRSPWQPTKNP